MTPRLAGPERRQTILAAAGQTFAERGYERAGLDEIADRAGISKRVIYDHFESKRHLQMTLLESETANLLSFVAERVDRASSTEERVLQGTEAFFEFVESHPFAWRLLFRDPPADPEIADLHRRLHAQATAAMAGFFYGSSAAHAAVDDAPPQTIEMLAEMFKRTLNGLAGWWYDHPDVERSEIVSAVMDYAWLGLDRLSRGESRRELDL